MIGVIFASFVICYLPITVAKVVSDPSLHLLSITGCILIYLTTCINPVIYVLMSSEYRYIEDKGSAINVTGRVGTAKNTCYFFVKMLIFA